MLIRLFGLKSKLSSTIFSIASLDIFSLLKVFTFIEIVADAPLLKDHLNDTSKAFFDEVCKGLTRLDIAFTLDPGLVRGLDYYTHTAFEFVTETLGAQGAVIAGGRYDGLI